MEITDIVKVNQHAGKKQNFSKKLNIFLDCLAVYDPKNVDPKLFSPKVSNRQRNFITNIRGASPP
eukprot:6469601-Amphidinium_carterae.1